MFMIASYYIEGLHLGLMWGNYGQSQNPRPNIPADAWIREVTSTLLAIYSQNKSWPT